MVIWDRGTLACCSGMVVVCHLFTFFVYTLFAYVLLTRTWKKIGLVEDIAASVIDCQCKNSGLPQLHSKTVKQLTMSWLPEMQLSTITSCPSLLLCGWHSDFKYTVVIALVQ